MIDQLRETIPTITFSTQSIWLETGGISGLVENGLKYWNDRRVSPDVIAIKMISRSKEAQILTSESGLGSFGVISFYR